MDLLIWIGVALSALVYWIAWSLCRAAKQMDEALDALDRELEQRGKR
jgi:di/tricarboxylate transporter